MYPIVKLLVSTSVKFEKTQVQNILRRLSVYGVPKKFNYDNILLGCLHNCY